MLRKLQRHFGFHRRELNGISGLLILIVLVWLIPLLYVLVYEPDQPSVEFLADDWKDVEVLEPSKTLPQEKTVHYFKFDPNDLSATQWRQLGLRESQIQNIKNFEAKGGRFREKEDLRKIYTISEADYKRLESYIHITPLKTAKIDDSSFGSPANKKYTKAEPIRAEPLDLNEVDSLSLLSLRGIGPVFASRIIRYRDLLGGFYSVSQLQEVYGMDTMKYQQLTRHVLVDSTHVKRIAINRASFDELRKHPYIKSQYAKLIIAYKKQHGAYKSMEDLSQIPVFDEKYLRKIAPYILFDQ
ncbi:helix-hairpin-helix domain-containing protein [Olivibacter sp. CPCC 100613]|uniref:ComEA family DNA-binding protein n=1 Tax=Olivibacter sp. CPCC 100613 TaxID=3079931 RepID=UPI002FF98500